MTLPALPKIEDYSTIHNFANTELFLEKRMDYDGSGNMIYVGYSRIANADTSASIWFLVKLIYNGSNQLTRYQLPKSGVNFAYAWDNRTTSFV
jgi:hypothetical protein